MSRVVNFTPGVEIVLFSNILVVVSHTVSVDALPSYSSLLPPAVTLTLCVSGLFGLKLATYGTYKIFLLFGMSDSLMKKIVLVPFGMQVSTP